MKLKNSVFKKLSTAFVMVDSATLGSYSKFRRGRRKNLRSGAKVNVVAL